MVRKGRVVRSRTDYLLGTDISIFRNVSAQDPMHNTDHYMVVGHLRRATKQDHARYIKGRRKMLLKPPTEPTREDELFEALRRAVTKPHKRERHKDAWISEETWRLSDESLREKGDESESEDSETGPSHTGKPEGGQ